MKISLLLILCVVCGDKNMEEQQHGDMTGRRRLVKVSKHGFSVYTALKMEEKKKNS